MILPCLEDHLLPETELLEYRPNGAARELWFRREPELLLDGPAGTGKTRGLCQFALHLMEAYPGCRLLFIRRTRASMSETVLATWENKVLAPVGHPMIDGPQRAYRDMYVHPNGSQVILASFENIERLFSMEVDAVFGFESIEFTETHWTSLKRALRNGVMPWQPMYADTNPGPWSHWLNQRCNDITPGGRMTRLLSTFADNPSLPASYLEELDLGLPPHLRDRLFLGLWIGAQGLVVSQFGMHNVISCDQTLEPEAMTVRLHGAQQYLILPQDCLVGGPVEVDGDEYERAVRVERWVVGLDWGPVAPASIQLWAVFFSHGAFRACLVKEHYRPGLSVEEYGSVVAAWHRAYGVHRALCDHDRIMIGYLNDHALRSDGAPIARIASKSWQMGIDVLNYAFKPDGKGMPRAFVFDTALEHSPDATLMAEKRPFELVGELSTLSWKELKEGKAHHEQTDGAPDHATDAARYALVDIFGSRSPLTDPNNERGYAPGSMGELFKIADLLEGNPSRNMIEQILRAAA